MKNVPLLFGTILGTIVLIIGIAYFFSSPTTTTEEGTVAVDQAQLVADATNSFGPEDAQVTVVEFADFQCPSCKAAQPMLNTLKEEYSDSVRVVFRHFPLDSIHPNARLASQAAQAAAAEGKFWEYHDLLYENQTEWSAITSKNELLDTFGNYAAELEIDKASFLEKIESQEVAQQVATDSQLANELQLTGTPTFFVNGQQTSAPQLISAVESAREQNN